MHFNKKYGIILILVLAVIAFFLFVSSNTKTVILKEGQREGPFQVQKIYSDRVEGLRFEDYPVGRLVSDNTTLRIGDTVSNGCTVTLKLVKITDDSAIFSESIRDPGPGGCPICLSDNTHISTPNGSVLVKELKEGMIVWTADMNGNKQPSVVLKTTKVQVPHDHNVVHLVLDNGRELLASPRHPLSDGRLLANIKLNDLVDGSRVVSAELIPYTSEYTYDILPSGETGFYWANGILVKSTLAK